MTDNYERFKNESLDYDNVLVDLRTDVFFYPETQETRHVLYSNESPTEYIVTDTLVRVEA